ncbi:hypothetical protein D3C80_1543690 [compost metagenome]
MNIGFGSRRHVAVNVECAAHDDDLFHQRRKVRLFAQGKCKVGHTANGNDRDFAGIVLDCFNQKMMCRSRVQRQVNDLGDINVTKAVFTMDEGWPVSFRAGRIKRDIGTLRHRRGDAPLLLQEKGVAGGDLNRRITKNSGDANQIDVGMLVEEQQRHCVINARIRIEYHLMHFSMLRKMYLCRDMLHRRRAH